MTTRLDNEKKIVVLEKKNAAMKLKLSEYKPDGKDKWNAFKTEFDHDMEGIGQAFKDLTKKNTK